MPNGDIVYLMVCVKKLLRVCYRKVLTWQSVHKRQAMFKNIFPIYILLHTEKIVRDRAKFSFIGKQISKY